MYFRKLKQIVKMYQKGIFAPVVAIVASIAQSLKHRSAVHIYIDKDGDWHNRRREVTFVATELHALCFKSVAAAVMDSWCYDYVLKTGDVVIDIGAGIGDHAVVFSRLIGPQGRVIAIEAHPRTYRCLLKTIKSNNLHNVIAINVAASDRNGEVGMAYGENYQSSRIVTGGHTVQVKASRLDDILGALGVSNPSLVKMNIEGAETAALLGMAKTLRDVPHIVVSCHDFIADMGGEPALRTYNDVKKILQLSGYSLEPARDDLRPWFPYYLYGAKGSPRASD